MKNKFYVTQLSSLPIPKQFELLALKLEFSHSQSITFIGCYRPPSASHEALASLASSVTGFNSSELLLVGDLNIDWLTTSSDDLKAVSNSLNLTQLINSSTRPNTKSPSKSSLLHLILTNVPHKHMDPGVFASDLSDHCTIAAIRNSKLPKSRPNIICKKDVKNFCISAFMHDLAAVEWNRVALFDDIELGLGYFYEIRCMVNKHAPFRKFRVKGRNNFWFSSEIGNLLKERDIAWARARKTNTEADWLKFWQLRNKCTSLIKSAKSEFYLNESIKNINDPKKFWKIIKSSTNHVTTIMCPYVSDPDLNGFFFFYLVK